MHPTLESGNFVFVCHSKRLTKRNKLSNRPSIIKFIFDQLAFNQVPFNQLPLLNCFMTAFIPLKVGDVVAVDDKQYGLIIKRVVKISGFESGSRTPQQTLVQFRLRGDNVKESVTESDMGWVDASALIGKVIYIVKG